MKETREERFVRLIEARVNKLAHMLKLIGNMSLPCYNYTDDDVDTVFRYIREKVDEAESRLRARKKSEKKRFRLEDDIEPETEVPHICEHCGYYEDAPDYAVRDEDDTVKKICRHPELDFDTECGDHWLCMSPSDSCSRGKWT